MPTVVVAMVDQAVESALGYGGIGVAFVVMLFLYIRERADNRREREENNQRVREIAERFSALLEERNAQLVDAHKQHAQERLEDQKQVAESLRVVEATAKLLRRRIREIE